MTIPPLAEEAEASRKHFVQLRALRDRLQAEFHIDLAQLSMGMTQDFATAVEEGATLVRVGTAIFGERSKKQKKKATYEWSEWDERHRRQSRDG